MTGLPAPAADAPAWLAGLLRGDRAGLARALTAVENETADAAAVLSAIAPHLGRALVVGFTGPPGAGKSTLVNAYVAELRRQGRSVGVVAVDPSSPVSGGALLGDRIRMREHANDAEVFVRSLAARGHLGGLSRTAARLVDVMDAGGKDVVVVETVGAGQSEVEIADVAGVRVVVAAPGLGDDVQALKAGILEIADILVVNKADRAEAAGTLRQLAQPHRVGRAGLPVPVLATVATTGRGVDLLAQAIDERRGSRPGPATDLRRARSNLAQLAAEHLRERIEGTADPRMAELCRALAAGEIGFETAARRALALVATLDERS